MHKRKQSAASFTAEVINVTEANKQKKPQNSIVLFSTTTLSVFVWAGRLCTEPPAILQHPISSDYGGHKCAMCNYIKYNS